MLVLVGACDSSSRERAAPPDTIAEHLRSDPRWLTREGPSTTSSNPPPTQSPNHPTRRGPTRGSSPSFPLWQASISRAYSALFLPSPCSRNGLESPYPGARAPPRAPRSTVRGHPIEGGDRQRRRAFSTSLSSKRDEEEKKKMGWMKDEEKEEGKREEKETVISVGRAGCIRSNIMQAHTDSLYSNALDPLGPVSSRPRPPPLLPPSPRYTAYTQNIRPRVQGNDSPRRDTASRTCVGLRFSRAVRACPFHVDAQVYVCVCVYGSPYLHRNRGSIEPRKWPWNSHSWKVNSPTASRGAPRSSLKVRKVHGRPGERRMGCERVGTTVEEEVSKDGEGGGVEESGIRPETRGFRGSRKGLRRLIDCKTHGMDHKLLGRVV